MTAQGYIDPDYVDVAERIRLFYERFPDGRITTVAWGIQDDGGQGLKSYVWCRALAYRTADDPTPCDGIAWEPIPGPTPFTRDSELMNAQTSAWGRAIIAAGIPSKKVASADEVQARQAPTEKETPATVNPVTKDQHAKIGVLVASLAELNGQTKEKQAADSRAWIHGQFGKTSRADLTTSEAGKLIDYLEGLERDLKEAQGVPF